jgi:hypothetical protein
MAEKTVQDRVNEILLRFFKEPNAKRSEAYAAEIVTVVTAMTGGRDSTDSNRGLVTPAGQGAQSRAAGFVQADGTRIGGGGYRSNIGDGQDR